MIYLASPYSDDNSEVCQDRFSIACQVAGQLMQEGLVIYSPIVHNHPIKLKMNLPGDFNFWMRYDLAMLDRCDKLLVLMINGWKESKGITQEIRYALERGIPVEGLNPLTLKYAIL